MSFPASPLDTLRAWFETDPLRKAAWLCGLVVLAVYSGMKADEMAFDNAFIITDDTRLRSFSIESLRLLLTKDYWWATMASNLYRPVATVSFWFEYSFLGYGPEPLGYQIGNAVLHWCNALLLFSLARRFGLSALAALGAAIIYALHPVGTEAVANIVGRSDLIATFGVLAGLLCYFRALELPAGKARCGQLVLAGGCGLFGMMAKESAIVLPAIVAWHGILRFSEWVQGGAERRQWLWDATVAALALAPMAVFFVATRWIFSSHAGVTNHPFIDNPLMAEGFLVTRLSALGVWGMQLLALVLPLSLSNDYSFNAIPVAVFPFGNATALWGWVALGVLAGAGVWAWRVRVRWPAGIFLWGAYVIAMLPTSNLIIRIGSIRADRFHYLPSPFLWIGVAGFAVWALNLAGRELAGRILRFALVPALAWVVCLGALAHFRCYDWRSNLSLWSSALAAQPGSAKVQAASGNARVIALQTPENEMAAVRGHLRAMEIFKENKVPMYDWPMQTYADLIASYLSLYDSEIARGKKGPEIELYLDQAIAVFAEGSQVESAVRQRWRERYKDQDVDTAPMLDFFHRNYAAVLSRKGRYKDAVSALDEVLRLLPLKTQNYGVLADIHMVGGNYAAALDTYLLVQVMEPATKGDLSKIAKAAKELDASSVPLIADGNGEMKLNLNDPLVERGTRKALLRFRGLLLRSGLLVEAYRVDRAARYSYGIDGPLGPVKESDYVVPPLGIRP